MAQTNSIGEVFDTPEGPFPKHVDELVSSGKITSIGPSCVDRLREGWMYDRSWVWPPGETPLARIIDIHTNNQVATWRSIDRNTFHDANTRASSVNEFVEGLRSGESEVRQAHSSGVLGCIAFESSLFDRYG